MTARMHGLLAAAALPMTSALLLTGCGGEVETASPLEGLSANQVLKKSEKAASAASSVHVDADITDEDVELDIDMRMQSDGKRAAGSISSDGRTIEVRVLDQAIYFKADRDFWIDAANAEAAELFTGKWVKASVSDDNFADIAEFTDKDEFLDELLERDGDDGTLTRVKGRTVDGQKTVGLAEKGTEDPGTLYVAASDKPYPLLVVPEDKAEGQAEFSEWGEPVDVTAPPEDQVVDIDELRQ
jgi:hypothetical protein